ncbi:MAG: hypothetical protein ABJA02_03370 [Acidobacteriota bacterium]
MKASTKLIFALGILAILSADAAAQNYKIKQTTSVSGQTITSTVYVKGSRKRNESGGIMGIGGGIADIEQCDLKRKILVSDKKKLYVIEPFAVDDMSEPATLRPTVAPSGKVTKGGTITISSSINDTGERKDMFGLTARHIKMSMTSRSSADACTKSDIDIQTDGWYIDLPQFSCPVNVSRSMPATREPKSGCQDRTIIKSSGGGKLGFPLQFTQTMKTGDGDGMGFSQSLETIEFTKANLEDSLFDIPAGYTLAQDAQQLYSRPDISEIMRAAENSKPNSGEKPSRDTAGDMRSKRPGIIRIGVLLPTNQSAENISDGDLQSFLAGKLTIGKIEGFPVGSEADARAADCDYILTSDLSRLKQSSASKIGGIFGKVTNTDTSGASSFDAQVDFTLRSLKSGQSVLQNKQSAKTSGNAERAAQNVLAAEAAAVLNVAK